MHNYFVPVPQGQQGQRPGGRGGSVGQQHLQPIPMMSPQMFPRAGAEWYASLLWVACMKLNWMVFLVTCFLGPMTCMNGTAMRDGAGQQSQPAPVSALITALTNASPDNQISILGENLYPLVRDLEPEAVGRATGMLLEMDQNLIESPDALKSKVGEAMDVLRKSTHQQLNTPDEQLADLSLKNNHV